MLAVRATTKLLRSIRRRLEPEPLDSTGRLGEWHATELRLSRGRLVVFSNAPTALAILIRRAPWDEVAAAFAPRLAAQLERLGIARKLIAEEIAHASPLVLARAATPNRRAIGHLVDICFQIQAMDDEAGALATDAGLEACENFLANKFPHTQMPDCYADLAVRRILAAR